MADRIIPQKVICDGGLITSSSALVLSDKYPGSAPRLTNFEPSFNGGYRRINGYTYLNSDFPEVGGGVAEGKILGLVIFKDSNGTTWTIAARKLLGSNTYNFFYLNGTGWNQFTTGLTLDYSVNIRKIRFVKFNFNNGNQIVFVDGVNNATLFDGTNWTQLDPSGTGADFANAGGNQMLPAPSLVSVFKNHIFFSGDANYPSVVCHTSPNSSVDVTAASGAGQILAGFDVVQIKPFRSDLFTFGEDQIKKISVNDTTFVISDVTSNVGCVAPDSVIEISGDLLFLAQDGIRPVAGTARIGDIEINSISKQIQSFVTSNIQRYDMQDLTSVVIKNKSQFRYFFASEADNEASSIGLIGVLISNNESVKWEFSELLGIKVSCAYSEYVDSEEQVIHGGFDGCVYRQEKGSSFNGLDITAIYTTPYLDQGDTETRKEYRKCNVFVTPEGTANIYLKISFDWGNPDIYTPNDYAVIIRGISEQYDTGVTYDSGLLWGKLINSYYTYDIQGSGFSIQSTFVSSGQDDPFTIHGIIYELTPQGVK